MDYKSDDERMKVDKVIPDENAKVEEVSSEEGKMETPKNDDSNTHNSETHSKDDNQFSVPSTSAEIKNVPDAKVSNVKIVRGTKRMRIDSADANPSDKKGKK